MNSEIIKKLHMLRAIAPSSELKERVKNQIFAEPRGFSVRVFWGNQPVWARTGAYAFVLLLLVLLPALAFNRKPYLSSLRDAGKLSAEAASLPISIELEEVRYQENRNEIIGAAITEIKDTNVRHLKGALIESEIDEIVPASNSNEEIDRLLEQVTS